MKKILGMLVFALLVFSVSASAADKACYDAMQGKLGALGAQARQVGIYDYGTVLVYGINTADWWTGLVLFNYGTAEGTFMVGCFDTDGNAVCSGTLTLPANGMAANMLQSFMSVGNVPVTGSILVVSDGPFKATKFTGNVMGGFGEVEKDADYY